MIICILGDYGVGKDTFADMLIKELPNAQKIKSYTTRPSRYPNEDTHIFVPYTSCICHLAMQKMTMPSFSETLNIPETWLAYSIIDGHFYWTEKDQFNAEYNIYVIDDVGLKQVIDSFFDDVYIIEIIRPEYLINVSKKRVSREKMMPSFDYSDYVDIRIKNDEDMDKLQVQAHLAAKNILFNTSK